MVLPNKGMPDDKVLKCYNYVIYVLTKLWQVLFVAVAEVLGGVLGEAPDLPHTASFLEPF